MSKTYKFYKQGLNKIEEIQDAFLQKKKEKDLKQFFGRGPQIKSFDIFNLKSKVLVSEVLIKIMESLELLEFNSELESEIERSSLRLDKMKEEFNCVDISEEAWTFSKKLLLKISKKYWIKSQKEIPIPKIDFIDESIEFRWIKDKFKLILSITDYFDDIVIYVKTRNGHFLSEPVPRDNIIDWVLFWLDQF